MGVDSPDRVSTQSGAVFLSYASQDAEPAQKIAEALRAAGIEVWFDKSELRGGDVWDQKIRQQIRDCRLFVPIISAHSEARLEGYFRREWKLAADRTEDMASKVAFLVPVVIDDIPGASAEVPERFRQVQWTRLPDGEATPGFVALVRTLLIPPSGGGAALPSPPTLGVRSTVPHEVASPGWHVSRRVPLIVVACAFLIATAAYVAHRFSHGTGASPASATTSAVLADKSIAVLPFVDMSEKHDQEYFGDGMAEEILGELAKVPNLRVISRTSSFQYKDKSMDVRQIGAAIGARYVVEGTVRRAGDRVRITAQLVDASDGSERWAEQYDRDFNDVLKVQDEIAAALARALEVSVAATERGSHTTLRSSPAYEAYLRARLASDRFDQQGFEDAAEYYREALRLDPEFARAASALAMLQVQIGVWGYQPPATAFAEVRKSAQRAAQLDPSLAEPHAALAFVHILYDWDWKAADQEIALARTLESHDKSTDFAAAQLAQARGDWGEARRQIDAALAVDPLVASYLYIKGEVLLAAGRYDEAETSVRRALKISPGYNWLRYLLARILVLRGRPADALAVARDEPDPEARLFSLAIALYASGRRAEADSALKTFTTQAADWPFGIAAVHAFRGEADDAFLSLDRAYSERDVDLAFIRSHPEFATIAKDRRYPSFLRKMKLLE